MKTPRPWSGRFCLGCFCLLVDVLFGLASSSDRRPDQARSHRDCGRPWDWRSLKIKIVGAGLLAKAVDQPTSLLNVPASSRASPLPQVTGRFRDLRLTAIPCGSELARESGVSGDMDVECAGFIASRLTPTDTNGCQVRRARAPMAMNSAAMARASWRSPRATSSGICARGTRRHSRGSGSSPSSWQGLSCSASTTR